MHNIMETVFWDWPSLIDNIDNFSEKAVMAKSTAERNILAQK